MNPDILAAYQRLDDDQRAFMHDDFSRTLQFGNVCTLDCDETCPFSAYIDCDLSNRLERWHLWLQLHHTRREQPILFEEEAST